jgi:signal transduction histidine kinase
VSVLVIDDDGLSLKITAKALSDAGYQVITTTTAADGVNLAQQEQPQLIITNIGMPNTTSTNLIEALQECAPESSVITTTDYGAEQLAANALKCGAEDYLIRPVHPQEIVTVAAEVFERAELRRRNKELTEALRQRQAELEQRNIELEEVNARLREADLWKENLSSMIVHDLKNPLGVIQGTMIFFKGTLGDDLGKQQADLLESAIISSDRAIKLVTGILDVRRLEEGRMPIEYQAVAPTEVINMCLDEMRPLLTVHKLSTTVDVLQDLPPVRADYSTLIRILGNLLDNAAKFTPPGGHITIKARKVAAGIQFSITDTGYGIPPDQQDRIFEKFAQAGIRAEGKRAGVGLGLTFCKLAVEIQHGNIWVESDEGTGTTFHFTLPIWVGDA